MKKEKTNDKADVTANSDQLKILKQHFPSCFDKKGAFIPHKMAEIVGKSELELSKESYSLNWLGKSYARLLANEPPLTLLKENKEHNTANKNSNNLLIKGDNLEVLKHLRHAYREKVKMIYIDPPYNTGGDGFVYNDDRNFKVDELAELAGLDEDDAQRILDFTASHSNSHSAWLTFIYPRLYVARELLREDGVIFISIDDNEQAQLKMLCDEVFGEDNFVGIFSVENNPKGRKNSDYISTNNDYCIIFAKSKPSSYFEENIPKNKRDIKIDEQGRDFTSGRRVIVGESSNKTVNFNSDKHFSVYYNEREHKIKCIKEHEINDANVELVNSGYKRYISSKNNTFIENTYTKNEFLRLFSINTLIFKDGTIYEKNLNINTRIKSILLNKEYMAIKNNEEYIFKIDLKTETAGAILKELGIPFAMPKNTSFIKLLISLFYSMSNKNLIILDFFAGSGTTADAVMQLNAEDSGNRQYIMVQLAEPIDKKKNQVAYDFVTNELKKDATIFEITKERILRAAKKIKKDNPKYKGDLGFKEYEVVPMFKDQFAEMDELATNKSDTFIPNRLNDDELLTLLTTWMVSDGIALTTAVEILEFNGYPAYYVGRNLYFMYSGFTTEALKAFIKKLDGVKGDDKRFNPNKVVLFGYNFESKYHREIAEALKNYTNRKSIELDARIRY